MSFSALGLMPELVNTLTQIEYLKPTPIQAEVIPLVLEGKDILASAETGTGKTAAFALPLLQMVAQKSPTQVHTDKANIQVLIMTPTRELAIQIEQNIQQYSHQVSARTRVQT